jgi:hypothetical protein
MVTHEAIPPPDVFFAGRVWGIDFRSSHYTGPLLSLDSYTYPLSSVLFF